MSRHPRRTRPDDALPAAPPTNPDTPAAPLILDWQPQDVSERLDRWISRRLPDRARHQIQKDIQAGRIRVNGDLRPARYIVVPGDRVTYEMPDEAATRLQPESIPLNIVFEDEHLLVINKPAGLVVHPAPGNEGGTLANALLAHVGPELEGVGDEGRWGVVHRLDAGTSGLILAARTQPACEALVAAIAERRVTRQYLGVVIGQPMEDEGTVDRPIGRRTHDRRKMGVVHDGRPARTDWRVLLRGGGVSLMALTLHTGRTHQIRVHLQAIGNPIVGDETYGWTRTRALQSIDPQLRGTLAGRWPRRPLLHAARLRLSHPVDGRPLDFYAPPPTDFDRIGRICWAEDWQNWIKLPD